MTGRGAAVQGALAAAGLVAAYFTWQREPALSAGEVIAFDVSRGELQKVRYEDQQFKSWAELLRDKDENGAFVSVRLSGSDISNVPLPSSHPVIPIKVPDRLVRGNESADRLFERFAPFRTARGLGVLDAAKLKDLGLDATKKRLVVTARGQTRSFAIVPAPPGGSDPYIRDEQDGRVYVVARQILTDMQSASTNLVERRMQSFRLEEIDRLVVAAGGKSKELQASRVNEAMPGIRLAPVATPDKPDETAKNWHDRVWALFPSEVQGKGEVPKGGPPQVALKIEYFARGRRLGWLELARAGVPKKNESSSEAPPSADSVYGRSGFTHGWMKLPGEAFTLISEGETLVSR